MRRQNDVYDATKRTDEEREKNAKNEGVGKIIQKEGADETLKGFESKGEILAKTAWKFQAKINELRKEGKHDKADKLEKFFNEYLVVKP